MEITMSEAIAMAEFPFVADLPKRKKSALRTALEELERFSQYQANHGTLVPVKFASRVLCVSTQRVYEMIQTGKLESVEFSGHPFVTQESVLKFCRSEKDKGGRPRKTSIVQAVTLAAQLTKDVGQAIIPD